MKSELISVVVLVYNTEQYISKCLSSILKQTYQNLEIIVINDGSTDRSSKIINRIASKDKRIKIFERENKGRYLSRLEGYKKAKGKYILYVDSDDWISKDMIELMYKNLKEYKADVVRCQYKHYENDSLTIPKPILNRNVFMDMEHLEPQFFDLLYRTNHCNTICKQLMKKEIMKGIEDVEENLNYCEDLACNLKIYKNMKSILLMPDELYVYNINNSYHKRKSSIEEIEKKIQDTIYVYNNLFLSIKDFQIKDRKLYKKIAAIKMIEKITILLEELIKSKLSKKELISEIEKIMSDKKVEEAINVLKDEDISSICDELKGLNKHTKKGIILLLNQKYNTLYTYNKNIFLYIKTKFKNE
jgi:glycosyltransferase involved in cell wall biosynthesis